MRIISFNDSNKSTIFYALLAAGILLLLFIIIAQLTSSQISHRRKRQFQAVKAIVKLQNFAFTQETRTNLVLRSVLDKVTFTRIIKQRKNKPSAEITFGLCIVRSRSFTTMASMRIRNVIAQHSHVRLALFWLRRGVDDCETSLLLNIFCRLHIRTSIWLLFAIVHRSMKQMLLGSRLHGAMRSLDSDRILAFIKL